MPDAPDATGVSSTTIIIGLILAFDCLNIAFVCSISMLRRYFVLREIEQGFGLPAVIFIYLLGVGRLLRDRSY